MKLDVRPILASGQEPFAAIMRAVDQLLPEQSLTLIAPFKPVPLIDVMARKGFYSRSEREPDGSWRVVFSQHPSPTLHLSPGADGVAGWPGPSKLVDLSSHESSVATSAIEDILDGLANGDVCYVMLADAPGEWLDRFTHEGYQWAWGYDRVWNGYGLLVRKLPDEVVNNQ